VRIQLRADALLFVPAPEDVPQFAGEMLGRFALGQAGRRPASSCLRRRLEMLIMGAIRLMQSDAGEKPLVVVGAGCARGASWGAYSCQNWRIDSE
jgi:hypothetical protein